MNQFERAMQQLTYDRSRKRTVQMERRSRMRGYESPIWAGDEKRPSQISTRPVSRHRQEANLRSIKKMAGLVLILIGVLFVLTKCFFGGKPEAPASSQLQNTTDFKVSQSITLEEYVQNLELANTDLGILKKSALNNQKDYAHTVAVWVIESYKGTPTKDIKQKIKNMDQRLIEKEISYGYASNLYKQFLFDIKQFPIGDRKSYTYTDTWKQQRTYKGDRPHYGIDILSNTSERGEIEIQSITDGIVEQVGWNELGGYRVGIRSPGGAYFYYAHLNEKPEMIEEGDWVAAGDVIGTMGDTGYGEEGTRGLFPVHLHVGIAVTTPQNKEYWVNPYAVLTYLERLKE